MKTEEQLFNELAAGELKCPSGASCYGEVPPGTSLQDVSRKRSHTEYSEYIDCLSLNLVQSLASIIRSRRERGQQLLPDIHHIAALDGVYKAHDVMRVSRETVLEHRLQFAETPEEFSNLVIAKLASIVESLVHRINNRP